MNLIDKKDNIAFMLHLIYKPFYSAFKLTSELSSCDKRSEVKQMNLLISELGGHIAVRYTQGKTLCDCCFADTGFTYKAGIVL